MLKGSKGLNSSTLWVLMVDILHYLVGAVGIVRITSQNPHEPHGISWSNESKPESSILVSPDAFPSST